MKKYRWLIIISVVLIASFSCEREINFELTTPSLIAVHDGPPKVTQEPGKEVFLEFKMQAASGLDEFRVFRDDELIETISFTQGEISNDYRFLYSIPTDAQNGTELNFTFELIDKEERKVQFEYLVLIDATFSEIEEIINGQKVTVIKGRLNEDYALKASNTYMVDSTLSIENNSSLSIEKGSTIYFKTYTDDRLSSRLMISRGSKIYAEGTATEPIVFTSDKVLKGETPGAEDWGGIYMYGKAPTNEGDDMLEEGFRYGGNIPNDNSGSLSYIRIEYAGKRGAHALHLYGVGSNTKIHHLEVYRNQNIGIRLKGGRVSLKYIAVIGHGGYGVWGDYGWQGNGQFWILQTDRKATLIPVNFWNQARSIEMRNDADFFLKQPQTTFKISNATLIGNGYEESGDYGTRRGIRIRRGATGILQNAVVTQFPNDAVRVEDLDIAELGESMILANTRSFNNANNYEQDAKSFFLDNPEFNVTTNPVPGISLTNYVGSLESSFNPSGLGNWFTDAPYIGAVENASNDWTTEGEWFRTLDGSIK